MERGTSTRGEIVDDTGLSKASVARLVDELLRSGFVSIAAQSTAVSQGASELSTGDVRGRPPERLTVPLSLGHVIGVSFGLQRTVVVAADLTGAERYAVAEPTPEYDEPAKLVRWLASRVETARSNTDGPLHRVTVALPVRVAYGRTVQHPPERWRSLDGLDLAAEIERAVGVDVTISSDANSAHAGLVDEGFVARDEASILLSMSTVLTVDQRDASGRTVLGRSGAFGDLSLLPVFGASGSLASLLSTTGVQQRCREAGVRFERLSELWKISSTDVAARNVRADFTDALETVLRMISVWTEASTVVLLGRLAPLVELVLPDVQAALTPHIAPLPRVAVVGVEGTSNVTARGAARTALVAAQSHVREQLTRRPR